MVRAPGGQLITRIKTEAAAGKLSADVVNHSDRGLMLDIENLFQDYAPPNAGGLPPDVLVSPKLWPQATLGWSIAYNTELIVKNPPKTWMDLTKPEYKRQADRPGHRARPAAPPGPASCSSARCWARTTGRSRPRPSPCCIPPVRRRPTRWCAARSRSRRLLYNIVFTKKRDGAPVEIIFPPEGVPLNFYAAGITKTAAEPERRQAVPQLVPVGRGPGLHDQGAGLSDLAEDAAGRPAGLRPEQW